MRLNMYLSAKRYISGYEFIAEDAPRFAHLTAAIDTLPGVTRPLCEEGENNSIEIKLPIMYWRKANHIHKWFVDNVQDGKDDCRYAYVDFDKLKELAEKCAIVAAAVGAEHIAAEHLPVASRFFFGGTSYDSRYYDQTRDTLAHLEKLIEQDERGELAGWVFEYHSSW